METKQRTKRRLTRGLLWLTAVPALLLVLVPVWFPWVLTPIAGHYGIGFAAYDRIGWARFALSGVHGAWGTTRLQVRRVESVLPTTWLWRQFNAQTNDPPLLTLSDGQLVIGATTTNAVTIGSAELPGSTDETLNRITQIGLILQRWLPAADLANCTIQIGTNQVSIPQAHWRAGRLKALVRSPAMRGAIEVASRYGGDSALELSAEWEEQDASLHGGFSRNAEGWCWNGQMGWLTNRADLTAQFATNGWWPARAQLDCRRWQIPAHFLPVAGYENLVASLTANLVSNRFDLQATGVAQPTDASAQTGLPTVNVALSADGDPSGVRLNTLSIQSSWLQAELTNTLGITWAGELLAQPAQLRVTVDLTKLPGATLTGKAEGVVQIEPQGGRTPLAQFRFSAGPLSIGPMDAKSILVRGNFAAPILKLDEMRADFTDGSSLLADGSFDNATQGIVGGRWQLSGSFLEKILPGFSYAALAATGELHGPLTNLAHHGEAVFTTARAAGLKPFDFRVKWNGHNQQLITADIEWRAGESVLSIGAGADFDVRERRVTANLNQLTLRRENEELYALQQPCAITFRAGQTNAPGDLWTLAVDAFQWRGEHHTMSANADLAWPSQGNTTLTLTNFAFADFSDFLEADLANILLTELAVSANWSNGPVHSVISVAGSMTNGPDRILGLRGNVKTGEWLLIEQLTLASGFTPTMSVTGAVPVKIIPGRNEGMLFWDKSQPIALAGNWNDGQPEVLTVPLGTWGELAIARPELRFQVSGTPDEPSAELTVGAAKLAWQSGTNNSARPKLEAVELALNVRPDAIRLKTFSAQLDGQQISASGEWPLPAEAWRGLWSENKLPDWNQAQGRLELKEAQVAAFSAYLPEMLSREGQFNAALDLKPGKRLAGVLSLTNAATRPISTITPVRDIAALVRFDGDRAVLENFSGQIGGQPVRADGFVSVPNLDGSGLDYHLNLRGTNVPLSRSPELLLRGDFALSLRGGSNQPPLLSGRVTLRDGLFVQTTSALVWSAPKRPEWRPPYFSVTNAPFAHWKLDLAVRGNQFLRARTPVFSGIASADFHLHGSLVAPVLTGDARLNSGRLIFPFGALTLNQGMASFSGNDPRGPDLLINASGRNYRYDLRLEVRGAADGANVVLSATPPLSSEQILLMLTAGEMPQSNFAFSNRDRAGRLGSFLGTDLLSRYLGSDPATERLIFRTGENISGEGRLTYSVEYRLIDRWSIFGEYDEFNAFNADLKWKVFTR